LAGVRDISLKVKDEGKQKGQGVVGKVRKQLQISGLKHNKCRGPRWEGGGQDLKGNRTGPWWKKTTQLRANRKKKDSQKPKHDEFGVTLFYHKHTRW